MEPELAKARSTASQMQAEAIEARLEALAKESDRIQGLEKKGIVSVDEAENKLAETKSEQAKLEAAKAQMTSTDVEFQGYGPAGALRWGGGGPLPGSRCIRASRDQHPLRRGPEQGPLLHRCPGRRPSRSCRWGGSFI